MSKPAEVEEFVDRVVHRPLAALLLPPLVRWRVTPNQVTLLAGSVGVLAGAALACGAERPAARLAGGLLLFASVVLDCLDGQLARARGMFSTTGAILDGLSDYAVGIAYGLGATWALVSHFGSGWLWLLGAAGLVSGGIQMALFDHAKARYLDRVSPRHAEREGGLEGIGRERAAARAAGRRADAFLLGLYARYTRAQHISATALPARDPAAYRTAHRRRMVAWTLLGSGTHNLLAYLSGILSFFRPEALAAYFVLNLTVFNLFLALLQSRERRQTAA